MKKKIFVIAVSLVLSVALFAGCAENKPAEENATLNQAQAASPTVKNVEQIRVNPDAAIDIALKHAGVSRENAVMFETPSLDEENGKSHYDIEFEYDGFEYDYEIAVDDGAVLKAEKEAEKVNVTVEDKAPEKSDAPVSKENKGNNGYISVEAAKQKALDDAGVKAEDAVFLKAYYDSDDLVPHFEIKFESKGFEYEYEIKASDGSVLEKDIDKETASVRKTDESKEYISAESAKSIAYEHAAVKASEVKHSKAELDRDDMVVHYDVEFVCGKYEYEYEINAETGKIIAYDKEFDD